MFQRRILCLLFALLALSGGTAPAQFTTDPSLRDLLQSRLDTARQGYQEAEKAFQARKGSWEQLASWSQRWLQAQLELASPTDSLAFRETHLRRLKEAEAMLAAWHQKGQASLGEVLEARFQRLEVEIDLARGKANVKTTTERISFYSPPEINGRQQSTLPRSTATIAVTLPANAVLRFDGVRTNRGGGYREFLIKDLVPDCTYTYNIRATWNENGKEVTPPARPIKFQAGDRVEVDLTLPSPEQLGVPPASIPKP